MEKALPSLEALEAEAKTFTRGLVPKASGATLLTLSGELGAGKTAFTQALARTLGVTDAITSPTFVLMKIYQLPEEAAFRRLVHIDAYRLQGREDLAPLGFDEVLEDKDNLVVVEWPQQVDLMQSDYALTLMVNPDESRTITYGT
ncbi:MAG TPA: tRNA (adenosine(37)-N6)-threonylcarbamoyltransferase complex ATPase subunit type 1 TsaE [Candidatus Paceibacterota bacterium]|nr:tRNA (adenosine(37)-N6)-threonylcarbamoyltransferase complex ATPase subunit type 1 TsaE [Candidatus Paceibacterota bacterium]